MRMKSYLLFVITVVLAGHSSLAYAGADKRLDQATGMCRTLTFANSGWVSQGHEIFKNSCKTCHNRKNDKGAPFLYAESRTMEGWNRVFYKRHVKCARQGAWDNLSKEELLLLNDYLYWNAFGTYDANSAERCG